MHSLTMSFNTTACKTFQLSCTLWTTCVLQWINQFCNSLSPSSNSMHLNQLVHYCKLCSPYLRLSAFCPFGEWFIFFSQTLEKCSPIVLLAFLLLIDFRLIFLVSAVVIHVISYNSFSLDSLCCYLYWFVTLWG